MGNRAVSIFGLGYVGCVGMACIADNGHKVIGVDINSRKVDLINNGRPTIVEKDIDGLMEKNFKEGRISATKDHLSAVKNSDISIICVGTPSTEEGHLNLEYIYRTSENIANGLAKKNKFHVIAIRSTVLPGTNKKVGEIIEQVSGKTRNKDFAVVSNPEFLREGSAVHDYFNPPVTVLGSDNQKAIGFMKELYKNINAPAEEVEIQVAEIIKYVNNSFHALKITFANEVGNISKKLGIDSHQVMKLFTMDKILNISSYYFKPGFAYGGSCLPKDLKALKTLAHDHYIESPVLESIEKSNSNQKEIAYDMVNKTGKSKVGILGLSFKKGTDDLRYSPSVELAERLLGKGYKLRIYDPFVNLSKLTGTNKEYIDNHLPHLSDLITDDLNNVISNSEVLLVTQKSEEFSELPDKYPDKTVLDVVRFIDKKSQSNYEGISW